MPIIVLTSAQSPNTHKRISCKGQAAGNVRACRCQQHCHRPGIGEETPAKVFIFSVLLHAKIQKARGKQTSCAD